MCSECHFSLTNEYPNLFVTANYSKKNVQIYSVVYIFTNVCSKIFVHVVYSQMKIQIYSYEIIYQCYGKWIKMDREDKKEGWGPG